MKEFIIAFLLACVLSISISLNRIEHKLLDFSRPININLTR